MNPRLSLFLGILFIAFSPIFVRLAHAPALTSAFHRMFFAWLLLMPYCLYKGLLKIDRKDIGVAILSGIIFAADISVWNISILKISATVSTLLANLAPVWVGLLSLIILKKRSGWLFWLGTAVAIVGMIVLVGYQNIMHLQVNIGVLLAVLASFFYACYILLTKSVLQRVNTITFMFYSMLSSIVVLFIFNLFQGNNLVTFSAATWFYFIATGVVCQLLGWLTINYAIKHLPSTNVSITLLSQTVFTGLLAVWLLHEKLGLTEIIGSVIVLGGIAITFLKPSSSNKIVN
ncbi:DMT family transporter [Mucilaginibacter gynuensis]|uniref:DMT family transporter n=1 Tax=Mucilaginibacter gynuensis TaxID=1302236 RepID=A0ABP8GIY7_9SPHI